MSLRILCKGFKMKSRILGFKFTMHDVVISLRSHSMCIIYFRENCLLWRIKWLFPQAGVEYVERRWDFKNVHAHCYCASPVHMLFIRHARATSFSSARTKLKTPQNLELMTFAITWYANFFLDARWPPLFFRQITSFSDSFHYTKKQKKSLRGKF